MSQPVYIAGVGMTPFMSPKKSAAGSSNPEGDYFDQGVGCYVFGDSAGMLNVCFIRSGLLESPSTTFTTTAALEAQGFTWPTNLFMPVRQIVFWLWDFVNCILELFLAFTRIAKILWVGFSLKISKLPKSFNRGSDWSSSSCLSIRALPE